MNEEFNNEENINSTDKNVVEQTNESVEDNNMNINKNNKTKKVLLAFISIILIFLIALTIYFVMYKKDNSENGNNNNIVDRNDKEEIVYEIKNGNIENNIQLKNLYVNGKKVNELKGEEIKITEFNNVLIVEILNQVSNKEVYSVDKNGKITKFDYYDHPYGNKLPNTNMDWCNVDKYLNKIIFTMTRDNGIDNSTGWMCEKKEVAEYTVVYKYLGNNKYDKEEISSSRIIEEKYLRPEGCEKDTKYPFKSLEELKNQVLTLPLNNILNWQYDYKYIYEADAISTALSKLSYENKLSKEEWDITKFDYDELYVHNGGRDETAVKYYKGEDFVNKVKELYGYNLQLENGGYGGCQILGLANNCIYMAYDKIIDKLYLAFGGGTAGTVISTIVDSSLDNGIYKIKYVNTSYAAAGKINGSICYQIVDKNDKEHILCSDKELNDYNLSHKNELSQYEVSFKINDDSTYEFLNIKKEN